MNEYQNENEIRKSVNRNTSFWNNASFNVVNSMDDCSFLLSDTELQWIWRHRCWDNEKVTNGDTNPSFEVVMDECDCYFNDCKTDYNLERFLKNHNGYKVGMNWIIPIFTRE